MWKKNRSFTLIELVAGIVILGTLVSISTYKSPRHYLNQARNQLLFHLTFTRFSAMNDELFVPAAKASLLSRIQAEAEAKAWQKKFWRLQFHDLANHGQTYSIYSEVPTSGGVFNNNPAGLSRIARDPLNNTCLSYGSDSYTPIDCRNNREIRLRFQKYYNLSSIIINSPCGNKKRSETFLFDYFGTPYCGSKVVKMNQRAEITLSYRSESVKICIEPNTGYAHEC